jgi:Leucine-rich repeat (LRR) protein
MKVYTSTVAAIWCGLALLSLFTTVTVEGFSVDSAQIDALQSLYTSTNGEAWDWAAGPVWRFNAENQSDPCADDTLGGSPEVWQGLQCDQAPSACAISNATCKIITVSLSDFNLIGSIPHTVGNLTALVDLDLSKNLLGGSTIPDELGQLASLQYLVLDSSQLEGTIPSALAKISSLEYLVLNSNLLKGVIPSELGLLENMRYLYLYGNMLEGSIPSELGRLVSLQYLVLDSNLLDRNIPSSLGQLTSLIYASLSDNMLEGAIPSELGGLASVAYLSLYSNLLEGSIPSALGKLSALVFLSLCNNLLDGSIPSELGELASLQSLILYNNLLEGNIPSELGNSPFMTYLYLFNNFLEGQIPAELSGLSYLVNLDFSVNLLSGSLPTVFEQLISVEFLYLNDNMLDGTIPSGLGKLSSVLYVDIKSNLLNGTIPSSTGQLPSLISFDLSDNLLEGGIPSELGNLLSLQFLSLSRNLLDGNIPIELGQMISLEYLYAYDNLLGGSIPSQLSQLAYLKYIDLDTNLLEGTIPSALGQLVSLEYFDLHGNLLDGSIPSELGQLTLLGRLNLFNNLLEGVIPSALGKLVSLSYLDLHNNLLEGSLLSSLGQLTALQRLDLENNWLEGGIPSALGQLISLEYLDLHSNLLEGSLSSALGELAAVEYFDLSKNFLEGSIPAELGKLIVVELFDLSVNLLEATVPTAMGQLSSLQILDLSNNMLEGILPSELGQALLLGRLDLSKNLLEGPIPSALGQLEELGWLYLFKNELTGGIPSELGLLQLLQFLDVHSCSLTGTLPTSMGSLPLLVELILHDNKLTGPLPTALGTLRSLNILLVQNNKFTGELSPLFDVWADGVNQSLATIDVSNNKFSGSIPVGLFSLPTLVSVAAVSCCFEGELPDTLCSSPSLEVLILDGLSDGDGCTHESAFSSYFSSMRGSIPQCVYSMPSLRTLSLTGNGFSGSFGALPSDSALVSLRISHNILTGGIGESFLQHPFEVLDASYNRLSRTISSFSAGRNISSTLRLEANRISGELPESVDNPAVDELVVVRGNSFACSADPDMASGDPDKNSTFCGSENLDAALYFTLVVLLIVLFLFVICYWGVWKADFISSLWRRLLGAIHLQSRLDAVQSGPLLLQRFVTLGGMLFRSCTWCAALVCVVCVPLFGFLKLGDGEGQYETHTYQYSYFMSAAMLSGGLPAALLLTVWLLVVLVLYWLIDYGAADVVYPSIQPKAYDWKQMSYILLFVAVNVVVALGLNGLYVFVLLSDKSSSVKVAAQVCVALLRLVWGQLVSSAIVNPIFGDEVHRRSLLLSAIFVFNNIVAPCLVVVFSDPSCFVELFIEPDASTSTYTYPQCIQYRISSDSLQCNVYADVETSVTYYPSFIYNFQCGTSLIKAFVPVVLVSYTFSIILSALMILLANVDVSFLRNHAPAPLMSALPALIRGADNLVDAGNSSGGSEGASDLVVNLPREVAVMTERLAMLLSFGLMTPYVALVCGLSSFMLWMKLMFLLFVYMEKQDVWTSSTWQSSPALDVLNKACSGISSFSSSSVWVLSGSVSALFIGSFAIDIAADDSDISWYYAILFLIAPVALFLLLYLVSRRCWKASDQVQSESAAKGRFWGEGCAGDTDAEGESDTASQGLGGVVGEQVDLPARGASRASEVQLTSPTM